MTKPTATERTADEHVFSHRLGRNIRALREAAGLNQGALAQRMGIDQATLSLYELGKTDMPASRLCRIAAILNVAPAMIVSGEENTTAGASPDTKAEPITILITVSERTNDVKVEISGRLAKVAIQDAHIGEAQAFPLAA